MTEYDVAIIGAGTAGLHAYRSAVAGGADVVVIERGERGSTCTATGCIPSKLLLASARAAVAVRDAAKFGVVCERYRVDGAPVTTRLPGELLQNAARDAIGKLR